MPETQHTHSEQPGVAVVLPTYNRSDIVLVALEHLERQTWKSFEVVVVDDGSTDRTAGLLAEYAAKTSLNLRILRQDNAGPASARNRAITALRAPICLFIGDDILASPFLVEEHFALHQEYPEQGHVAVGLTQWSNDHQQVTPFMRWLDQDGMQFNYGELLRGEPASWRHFYTSNLSLKTALLRRHPFNERFPGAAVEDIELGYRLHRAGELTMHFLPMAIGEHVHPTTVDRSCRRQTGIGEGHFLMDQLWPDRRIIPADAPWKARVRTLLIHPWILALLRRLATWSAAIKLPNRMLLKAHAYHFQAGYLKAKKASTQ